MRSSQQPKKDLSVYDFDEFAVESASAKFAPPKSRNSKEKHEVAADKYIFLQAFSSGLYPKQIDAKNMPCIDLVGNGSPDPFDVDSSERKLDPAEEKFELDEDVKSSTCYEDSGNTCVSELDPVTLLRGEPLTTGTTRSSDGYEQVSQPHSYETLVDLVSDDEEMSISDSISLSTCASDLAEDEDYLDHRVAENCYTTSGEKEQNDSAVVVNPDYVIYENVSYLKAQLMLFSDLIQIKCLNTSGKNDDFVLEWATADIIRIESLRSERVNAALVKFHLRATTANGKANINGTCEFDQLIFALNDIHWLEKELMNKSLSERYKGICLVLHEDDLTLEEYGVERNKFFSRHYFAEIPDSSEDVIYPKGDPDAVSISRRDIELLQPDTFINDTIVDFYIKYLKSKIPPNERDRFHFFNSFFFRKLADLDKDRGSALEGRAAFLRVRKWTRKVNIFEKDYIFIPVNFSLHWSLLVICHPGQVAFMKDNDTKESPKVPCILHMDSIKGSHSGLKDLIQSYLWEEWKERYSDSADGFTWKSKLRFVPLELPQQENLYDCGLFLLHYVELFLEEAPVNFSPFQIRTFSSFLTVDWFTPSDASFKRALIRKLIYDLLNDPSQKVVDNCSDSQFSSGYHANAIDKKPVNFFHNHQCGPSETALKNAVWLVTENENKIDNGTSAALATPFDKRKGSAMYEFLEKGANSSAFPELQGHSFQEDAPLQKPQCAISPKEEHADRNEKLVPSSLDKEDCVPVSGIPTVQPFLSSQHYSNEAGEKNEMPLGSVQNNAETGLDLLLKASEIDENGKQASLGMDDGGYVSDSTSSTSSDNEESGHEDSQQLDADNSDEDKKYENSLEEGKGIEDKSEPEGSEMKCHESSKAEAEVRDTSKDCHKIDGSQGSGMHILKEKESLGDKAIPVGESSFPEDSGLQKRGIASMKIELQYNKRRRVLPSEGGRERN